MSSSIPNLQSALQNHRSGNFDAAKKSYQKILEQDPKNIEALHLLGILEAQLQNFQASLQILQQAIALDPQAAFLHNSIGNVYKNLGQLENAKNHYKQALQLEPNSATAHNNLANILLSQNDYDSAEQHYRKALDLKPDYADAHYNLGLLLTKKGNLSNEIGHLEKAIQLDPANVSAYNQIAQLYIKQNNFEKALEQYQICLEIDPDNLIAKQNIGALFAQKGETSQAIEYLKQALEQDPYHIETLNNLGILSLQQRNLNAALEYFLKILNIPIANRFSSLAQVDSSSLRLPLGDKERATGVYNNINEDCDRHSQQRGQNCQEQVLHVNPKGDRQESVIKPKCEEYNAPSFDVYYNIGVIYMDQNRYGDALNYLLEALKIEPQNFATLNNLGAVYLKMEDYEKAAEKYHAALQIQPNNAEIAYILSALQQNNQNPTEFKLAPQEYIKHLFDQYAPSFDSHLTKFLHYQVPDLIYNQLLKNEFINPEQPNSLAILDLGCGTGLSGAKFRNLARKLIGIDLSEQMLKSAKEKNIYDELHCQDINDDLKDFGEFDLVIAADTLVYIGDLDNIFRNIQCLLKPNTSSTHGDGYSYFAFTCENTESYPYTLQKTARFAHSQNYINEIAEKHSFKLVLKEPVMLRKQKNVPIYGTMYIAVIC